MSKRKWFWDFEYFSKRNSRVAYWSGFLMADGGLNRAGKSSWWLALAIQKGDEDHLRQFCDDIELSQNALFYMKDGTPRVHLCHMKLGEQLKPWGIVIRKTYNFVEPQVPPDLLIHYLRGWADGDGQIYANGNGARFTISGNPKALRWYANSLRKVGYDGNISFQDRNENTCILYIGGKNQTEKVISILCPEDCFRLERKWNTEYIPNRSIYFHKCESCGKDFPVTKYRHENEPTFGRFCSKECYDESQKKLIVNNKRQCARCKEWISLEDFSGNPSYCKSCWREYNKERRRKKGAKPLKKRETITKDGIILEKCPRCNQFKPKDNFKSGAYCRSCHAEYMREYRGKANEH